MTQQPAGLDWQPWSCDQWAPGRLSIDNWGVWVYNAYMVRSFFLWVHPPRLRCYTFTPVRYHQLLELHAGMVAAPADSCSFPTALPTVHPQQSSPSALCAMAALLSR
jgi:hypothetical protein